MYGDDVFLTRDDDHKLFMVEKELEKHYEMSRLNLTKFYIKFLYFIEGKMLIQCRYARLILHRYQMANCHPISTTMEEGVCLYTDMDSNLTNIVVEYQSLISNLIYYTITWRNLSFFMNYLSRFMSAPQEAHMAA